MNVQVGKVVASVEALQRLVAEKVPALTAFKLARITRQVETVIGDFEKARIGLVKQYGEPQEDGSATVKPENIPAFQAEFSQLIESEVALEFEPVKLESLGDIQLTTADMLALDYMLAE